MSGHAGFQAIGNHLPPPDTGLQVGGVGAPTQPPEPKKTAVSGGDALAQDAVVRQSTASPLARKLDAMLLQASKMSTRMVDAKDISDAADIARLSKADRKALAGAFKEQQKALKAVLGFTGRQIASALSVDENGVFDWNAASPAAKAIQKAVETQAKLSELFTDMANRPEITGDACDVLSELALQCDRRQSEITTLALELADANAQSGNDPALAKRLDAKLSALLQRQAVTMHGNAEFVDRLKEQLQPLADRLDAFAARPNASISSAEFMAYSIEVKNAAAALYRASTEGFPAPGGGRLMPDRDFTIHLAALATAAEQKLEDARTQIGNAALRNFAVRVVGLPEKFPIFAEENVDDLYINAPHLAKLVDLRQAIRNACLEYVKDPSGQAKAKIDKLLASYSKLTTKDVDWEINYLQTHLRNSDMDADDWDRVRAIFSAKPRSLQTQVAHFFKMAENVRSGMTPEQFLSTDSARALLEGRLSFPTLVEARLHGMSDADVDPALDDSRAVSTAPLGTGAVNTVHLVTYADGAQYVFKPEAPGRQVMENLTLSKDYAGEQQVAQLNLATQSVANALGLGDAVPKCTVGAHNGEYGLFMEKVSGLDGASFAKGNPPPGGLGAKDILKLPDEAYGKVVGGILRGLNRLEWLDLIAGQGDRHAHNYLIDVRPDLSVTVKGIDNDQSFPEYRTGLRTYVLKGKDAALFLEKCGETILAYPQKHQKEIRERFEKDPGVTKNPDGSITLDTTKFQSGELYFAAQAAIGMHGCTIPEFIDEDLYAHLLALKSGSPQRDALLKDLAPRLSPGALDSAAKRLDAAIAHAEKLFAQGKVVRNADFAKRDVQNQLLYRELHAPANPVKPVKGYSLPSDCDVMRKSRRQVRSLFVRDLFSGIQKKGWFA